MIVPENQRFMAERMKARVRAHPVDHAPIVTAPSVVLDIIREAIAESPRAERGRSPFEGRQSPGRTRFITKENAMTTINYRTADVDGFQHLLSRGGRADAPKLLLLHGFPSAGHMFRDLIPLLADRFHVIAPDLPGFGQSGMPDRGSSATPSTPSPRSSTASPRSSASIASPSMSSIMARPPASASRRGIRSGSPPSSRRMAMRMGRA